MNGTIVTGYAGNLFFGILLILLMFKIRNLANGLSKAQESFKSCILQDKYMMEKLMQKVFLHVGG